MFFKKRLRKAPIFFKVGRFWGNKPRKSMKIDWSKKFFNIKNNRIELILFDPKLVKKPSKNDIGYPKNRG